MAPTSPSWTSSSVRRITRWNKIDWCHQMIHGLFSDCTEDLQCLWLPHLRRVLHPGRREGGLWEGLQEDAGSLQEVWPAGGGQTCQAVRVLLSSSVLQMSGEFPKYLNWNNVFCFTRHVRLAWLVSPSTLMRWTMFFAQMILKSKHSSLYTIHCTGTGTATDKMISLTIEPNRVGCHFFSRYLYNALISCDPIILF